MSQQGAELIMTVRDRAAGLRLFARYGITGEVVVADLADPAAARKVIAGIRPAIILNLAGYGVDCEERDERQAFQLNAGLVEAICAAMAASGGAG